MRVGIDGRSLAAEGAAGLRQPRGVRRYAYSLLRALAARHTDDDWQALVPRRSEPIPGVLARHSRLAGRAGHAGAALVGRPRLDRLLGAGSDVVWLPAPAPVAVSRAVPYVLTLHDLSFEALPSAFGAYERLWSRVASPRRQAVAATRVMAVSSATRDEALERWKLPPDRVVVVRSGVWRPPEPLPGELDALRRRLSLPGPYLLFVGALELRKGVEQLLRAYSAARRRGLEAALVLAGEGPLRSRLEGEGVVPAGRVSDRELGALYAGARATVLPSLLEGFGFTPLESVALGTPAVVSDLPALRETLAEGALRVSPGDEDALAEALIAVDRDAALRRRLVEAGRRSLAQLSWERAADEAHAVLRQAADEPRP